MKVSKIFKALVEAQENINKNLIKLNKSIEELVKPKLEKIDFDITYDKYDNDPLGFTVRYGHKFFTKDNDGRSLMGFYLRPEVIYSHYYYTSKISDERTLANMGALLGTVGYQYVYKRFLADFWVGGGYATGTPAETSYHHGFELWHWFGTYNPNIAMSFSIRLGVCF